VQLRHSIFSEDLTESERKYDIVLGYFKSAALSCARILVNIQESGAFNKRGSLGGTPFKTVSNEKVVDTRPSWREDIFKFSSKYSSCPYTLPQPRRKKENQRTASFMEMLTVGVTPKTLRGVTSENEKLIRSRLRLTDSSARSLPLAKKKILHYLLTNLEGLDGHLFSALHCHLSFRRRFGESPS
jgi:hypothetical protein